MLKIASVITAIVLAYAGLFSFMNVIAPRFMMGGAINSLLGIATDNNKQIEAMETLELGQRIMGAIGLVAVIIGFAVLFIGFYRAKIWAWWVLLVGGVISCIWGLIYPLWGLIFRGLIIAFRSNILYQLIVFAVFLVGLSIPINSFFKKDINSIKTETNDSQSKGKDL